jgi:Protein of unknown function (DUF3102)
MSEVGSNRLVVLAADIRAAHAGVLDAAKTAAERSIEAGRALIEAKALVRHGQWLPWLKEHCQLSERSAQLYMKIATLGLPAEVIADIGLKAATDVITTIRDPSYDPFADCDEEAQRQWNLFVAFGVPWPHVEWLLQRPFATPDEWLGPEGASARRRWAMPEPSERFKQAWADFQQQHAATSPAEAIAEAGTVEERRLAHEPRRRRRLKSATVADLARTARSAA